ncbi:unnamed protein product [Rhizophagus irregularis]|nr:unnamed protein product [Rhizophagus irregularis]
MEITKYITFRNEINSVILLYSCMLRYRLQFFSFGYRLRFLGVGKISALVLRHIDFDSWALDIGFDSWGVRLISALILGALSWHKISVTSSGRVIKFRF